MASGKENVGIVVTLDKNVKLQSKHVYYSNLLYFSLKPDEIDMQVL